MHGSYQKKGDPPYRRKNTRTDKNWAAPKGLEWTTSCKIQVLTLQEKCKFEFGDLIAEIIPALNIYNVRFVETNTGKERSLEDEGGRLHYLINHTNLITAKN